MKLLLTGIITFGFMLGCASRQDTMRVVEQQPQSQAEVQAETIASQYSVPQSKVPSAPKKKHTPKAVEDSNYSDKYMYPEDTSAAKKDSKTSVEKKATSSLAQAMTKEECIAMISQEKFDKYTTMFGSEASSLKRCTMLKAMKN